MPVKVPEIPSTTSLDQQFARIYAPIKETLDIYEGRVGDPDEDRVVKIGELADILTSDAIINAIIAEIGGGLDPADFLQVDGGNSMVGTLSIVTGDDPKVDARDSAGDEVLARFRNSDTGFASTDGLEVGILSTEVARLWNYEATNLEIGTNNALAVRALSTGELELYFGGVLKAETSATGLDVTGDVTATGDISATEIQGVDVHTAVPSDGDVLAYVAANLRYEPQAQSGGSSGGPTTGATVYRSTAQSLPAFAFTPIAYDTVVRDDENYWNIANPTRFTIPEDGWYATGFSCLRDIGLTGGATRMRIAITKNGTDFLAQSGVDLGNSADDTVVHCIHYFTAGEYVEFELRPNPGTGETTVAATAADLRQNSAWIAKLVVAGINAAFSSGVQKIRTSWQSATGFYVDKGVVDIQGSLYELPARLTITPGGLSASTSYYIYVTAPGSGTTLTSSEFSVSTTAPTEDLTNRGWYNGNDRCIGWMRVDGSGNIQKFTISGNLYRHDGYFILYNAALSNVWTTITITGPNFCGLATINFRNTVFNTNAVLTWRDIATLTVSNVLQVSTGSHNGANEVNVVVDINRQFQIRFNNPGTNNARLEETGFHIPFGIYNG